MKKSEAAKLPISTYVKNVYKHRIWQLQCDDKGKYLKHIKDCNNSTEDTITCRTNIPFNEANWSVLEVIPDTEVFVEML